jgi:hypothetical protein
MLFNTSNTACLTLEAAVMPFIFLRVAARRIVLPGKLIIISLFSDDWPESYEAMRRAANSRRKRKAIAPSSSEDNAERDEINDDDMPLFPKGWKDTPSAVPAKSVPQAEAVSLGDLSVTHVINGTWKVVKLGDRFHCCKLSREEWLHYYGGAWSQDEFPSYKFGQASDYFKDRPDDPEGKTCYLFETQNDVFDDIPKGPLRAMVLKGQASRAALKSPLGNKKLVVKYAKR